jgi:hypothetical protein
MKGYIPNKRKFQAGGIAQVVQLLFSNHEALGSIPDTEKKEKKKTFLVLLKK